MNFTVYIVSNWAAPGEEFKNDLEQVRAVKLLAMAQEGKTDANMEQIAPGSWKSYWIDRASAEEYIAYITEQAALNGASLLGFDIYDI